MVVYVPAKGYCIQEIVVFVPQLPYHKTAFLSSHAEHINITIINAFTKLGYSYSDHAIMGDCKTLL